MAVTGYVMADRQQRADSGRVILQEIEVPDVLPVKLAIIRMPRKTDVFTLLIDVGFRINSAVMHHLARQHPPQP